MNELLKTQKCITNWLASQNISNYKLVEDPQYGLIVDVEGAVNLNAKNLEKIAVKFNIVNGDFICSNNFLKSLEGAPTSVGGSFTCESNNLKSLRYCPQIIGKDFNCANNELTSLLYCPRNIMGSFNCGRNKLTSLEHCPETVGDIFWAYRNKIKNLAYLPNFVGDYVVFENNELLGEYQYVSDFQKIKEKKISDREKILLMQIVQTTKKCRNQKI